MHLQRKCILPSSCSLFIFIHSWKSSRHCHYLNTHSILINPPQSRGIFSACDFRSHLCLMFTQTKNNLDVSCGVFIQHTRLKWLKPTNLTINWYLLSFLTGQQSNQNKAWHWNITKLLNLKQSFHKPVIFGDTCRPSQSNITFLEVEAWFDEIHFSGKLLLPGQCHAQVGVDRESKQSSNYIHLTLQFNVRKYSTLQYVKINWDSRNFLSKGFDYVSGIEPPKMRTLTHLVSKETDPYPDIKQPPQRKIKIRFLYYPKCLYSVAFVFIFAFVFSKAVSCFSGSLDGFIFSLEV